jgi:c-di-GMP-binding flagellar brake protein YcgR
LERRKKTRHSIIDAVKRSSLLEEMYLEISLSTVVRGRVVDISLGGLGFEIDDPDVVLMDELEDLTALFVKIFFDAESIFAETYKIWSIHQEVSGRRIVKGGLQFSVISSEDRIKLTRIIEEIRKALE